MGFPLSRAVCPRRPLGQPVMRGPVLVVGGRGGTGGTSRVVRVLWSQPRRATVALVAVVSATGVPVMVGTAVIPRTTRVIPLSLESTPVALENLSRELKVSQSATKSDLHRWSKKNPTDLFVWWRAVFTGCALGLGGRGRSFQQARAGDRRGRGATTGPIWVACTWMVNCKKSNQVNHQQYNLAPVSWSRITRLS